MEEKIKVNKKFCHVCVKGKFGILYNVLSKNN